MGGLPTLLRKEGPRLLKSADRCRIRRHSEVGRTLADLSGLICSISELPTIRSDGPRDSATLKQPAPFTLVNVVIFVSYSHRDETWRERFEIQSKPLSRTESVRFWSDKNIKAGEWEAQIEEAMADAVAAVLLVSPNFLASDYIVKQELPYLLRAHKTRGLMIIWAYLEPCDLRRYPQIRKLQAMTLGDLQPMSKLNSWQWMETMLRGCDMIDDFLKGLERPVINSAVIGKSFPKISEIPLLERPARRKVEVLVYSADKKWWRQSGISAEKTSAKIQLGNDVTKKGTRFTVVAMTTDQPLTEQTYLSIPDCRTISEEFVLVRA